MNTLLEVEALSLADLLGELSRSQYLPRPRAVQTHFGGYLDERLVIARVLAGAEVCGKQCVLESLLATLELGPMQHPVGVEGVVDAIALAHLEIKTESRAARA